jgi:catalase
MDLYFPANKNKFIAFIDSCVLWLFSRFFTMLIALFLSLPKRNRMSHDNGIAGTGKARILSNPLIPENDFFVPGREFPLRVRQATATFLDDAVNDIRAISIKFSDHNFDSPFDMELNTGETSLFWNAASFMQFAKLRKEAHAVCYVDYIRKYPEGATGAIVSLRRAPDSFAHLKYYSQVVYLFKGKDDVQRFAKYRVVPFVDVQEPGLQVNPCDYELANQRVAPHETKGRNYLKYEFEDRVKREGVKYKLQIQLIKADKDQSPEVFNNMVLWDEKTSPWLDLAELEITKTLDWSESIITAFSVNNMPKDMGVIPAKSIYDYNSLNYFRAHSEFARKARLLSLKIFGMVKPIPDNDNRNSEEWGA